MFKKKDGDPKKPKAAAKPAVKAKVVVKAKPMAKPVPKPKKAYTPTPLQKLKSAEAGREAAQKSREEGKNAGYFTREADRLMQGITNSDKTKDSKSVKRSKSGGVIDQTKSKYSRNLYSGLNNKQLGYE